MPELPPKAFNKLSRTIGSGSAGPWRQGQDAGDSAAAPRRATTPAPGYAELQVTSNFSFLRGASHPDELVVTAAALGHGAIAITDRNSLAGIVRAHQAAKTVGIRLVVGVRLDLADGTSLLAYPQDRAAYGRLTRLLTLGKRRAAERRMPSRLRRCRGARRGADRRRAAAGEGGSRHRGIRGPGRGAISRAAPISRRITSIAATMRAASPASRSSPTRPGCRSSRSTTCCTTSPSGGRCRTS